ncbi:FAR1-related sequence 5-like protein [Tanacetum coccineum]
MPTRDKFYETSDVEYHSTDFKILNSCSDVQSTSPLSFGQLITRISYGSVQYNYEKKTAKAYGRYLQPQQSTSCERQINNVYRSQIDQDGAMRLAVAAEFPESKHRLCMWHIMQKIPAKKNLVRSSMFIGPEEFEDKWNKFMEEFNLVNHKWLSKMYRLRSSWIPAFFVDSPLCGLMRTTSRSESENSFLSYFLSFGATLKEIVAGSWLCSITGMSSDEGCTVCTIDEDKVKPVGFPEVIDKENTSENVDEEINLHQKHTGYYKVLYNKGDSSVTCCCQLFVRSGILCRHIFCVFKNFKVSCIPDQYILRRWTKDLIPPDLRNKKNRYGEKNEAIEKLSMEASIILDSSSYTLVLYALDIPPFIAFLEHLLVNERNTVIAALPLLVRY